MRDLCLRLQVRLLGFSLPYLAGSGKLRLWSLIRWFLGFSLRHLAGSGQLRLWFFLCLVLESCTNLLGAWAEAPPFTLRRMPGFFCISDRVFVRGVLCVSGERLPSVFCALGRDFVRRVLRKISEAVVSYPLQIEGN